MRASALGVVTIFAPRQIAVLSVAPTILMTTRTRTRRHLPRFGLPARLVAKCAPAIAVAAKGLGQSCQFPLDAHQIRVRWYDRGRTDDIPIRLVVMLP